MSMDEMLVCIVMINKCVNTVGGVHQLIKYISATTSPSATWRVCTLI